MVLFSCWCWTPPAHLSSLSCVSRQVECVRRSSLTGWTGSFGTEGPFHHPQRGFRCDRCRQSSLLMQLYWNHTQVCATACISHALQELQIGFLSCICVCYKVPDFLFCVSCRSFFRPSMSFFSLAFSTSSFFSSLTDDCSTTAPQTNTKQAIQLRNNAWNAWQCFLFDVRDCMEEWLVLCFYCPSLSPPSLSTWLWAIEYMSVVLFCYILDVMLCVKKKKNVDNRNNAWSTWTTNTRKTSILTNAKTINKHKKQKQSNILAMQININNKHKKNKHINKSNKHKINKGMKTYAIKHINNAGQQMNNKHEKHVFNH